MTVIFYGAGENARININKWIQGGLSPKCFADADPQKWDTSFLGYNVISLHEVFNKYPDYELFLTQARHNIPSVKRFLKNIGVPDERIKVFESNDNDSDIFQTHITEQYQKIWDHIGDTLSKKIFLGRLNYSITRNLSSIYEAMVCEENMQWIKSKQTYGEKRYGLNGLWQVLYEDYPIQQHKWYVLWRKEWFEYKWVVDKFLEAMPLLGIRIEAIVVPGKKEYLEGYEELTYITEEELLPLLSHDIRLIIGLPGWCLDISNVINKYTNYREILFPIADTAHPQYFEPDILQPISNEIFIDVGVFDLGNTIDFIKYAKEGFSKVYGFEPDQKCYKRSLDNLNTLPAENQGKIELLNLGLSSKNGILKFPSEYSGSGYFKSDEMVEVRVVSFDDWYSGEDKITFIKMDVEGAEMSVLMGMEQTIKRDKPKLAVCIYHKYEDLFDISSYLLSLVPEYKFYFRHYNSNETEAVLFCVIDNK